MIGNRIYVIALTAASAITGFAAPALAQQFTHPWGVPAPPAAHPFDGNWGIVAHTTNGHCGSVQFAVAISGSQISASGGAYGGHEAQLTGRVARTGRAQVAAVAGPRKAQGTGQFTPEPQGSGTWVGRGPSGTCSGVWNAYRSWF